MTGNDWLPLIERALIGRTCEIVRREADWALNISGGTDIALPVPWRIVAGGRIAFASDDDRHQFGLQAPLDGEFVANSLIASQRITGVCVNRDTLDLTILFDAIVRLETFSNSFGCEGRQIHMRPEDGSLTVVALGGGEVAVYSHSWRPLSPTKRS